MREYNKFPAAKNPPKYFQNSARTAHLFGEKFDPLDNVELLLGVDEGLEEEGGGQLSGHDCNVIHGPVTVLVQRLGHPLVEKHVGRGPTHLKDRALSTVAL